MAAVAQPTNTKYIHNGSSNGNGDTPSTPWSYANFQSLAASGALATNTAYKFLEGRYEDALTILNTQASASAPIVIEPNDGATVVFSGSKAVSGWQAVTNFDVLAGLPAAALGNAYKTTALPANTQQVINLYHMHSGGAEDPETRFRLKTRARFPNSGFLYANAGSNIATGTFDDDDLPATNRTDAYIVLRYSNWGYYRKPISQSGTTITYDAIETDDPQPGNWGYFLEGLRLDLDQEGEWAYLNGVLYYWPPGGQQPTADEVRVCIADGAGSVPGRLITFGGDNQPIEHVTLRDLTFEHVCSSELSTQSIGVAVRMRSGPHRSITVENCIFRDLTHGISEFNDNPSSMPSQCSYRGNTFERVYGQSIFTISDRVTIDGNLCKDVNLEPGQTGHGFAFATAIQSSSDDATVINNVVIDAGGTGIGLGGKDNPNVEGDLIAANKRVMRFSRLLNDHAGITFDGADGLKVMNNIVTDAVPNVTSSADGEFKSDKTVGIYFGNTLIRNTTVAGNVVSGMGAGIVVDHEPIGVDEYEQPVGMEGNRVEGNTVFGANDVQLAMLSRGSFTGAFQPAYDDVISDNILYCLKRDQWPVYLFQILATSWNGATPTIDFGDYSGNYYFNPFNTVTHYVEYFSNSFATTGGYLTGLERPRIVPFTLQGWNTHLEPTDASFTSPLRLKDYAVINSSAVAVAFHSTECHSTDNSWSNATPGTGEGSVDGHFKRFTDRAFVERWAAGGSSATVIDPGAATTPAATTYRIKVRMRSNTTDAIRLAPVVNPNSKIVDPSAYLPVSTNWADEDQEAILYLPDAPQVDRFAISLGNAQYGMGVVAAGSGNVVDVDHVRTEKVTLDQGYYESAVLPNHRLFYHCPLPGTEADDRNVASTNGILTVPGTTGCWSDVHGNFYATGEEITLDEWASIVLFRMDVPTSTLAFTNGVHTVSGNVTITANQNIAGSIVVPSGATLIIDGAHIGFAASTPSLTTNITVQPGGTLTLRNGATLRNWMGCSAPGEMWDGVKVIGQAGSNPQGWVYMESGASIRNALVGILAGDADPEDPQFGGLVLGGKVDLRNATFVNNVHDVVLHVGGPVSYDPGQVPDHWFYQPGSRFVNCQFITNGPLLDAGRYPKSHVSLIRREGASFRGCTFANDRTDIPTLTSAQLGHGIEASNSSYTVVNCAPPCTTPDPGAIPNTFRNLDHAVHATSSWSSLFNMVRNARFQDNVCAVYVSGETGLALHENEISMGRWHGIDMNTIDELYWQGHHRGIFTTSTNGLSIEENSFSRSASAPDNAELEGIVVGYTRDANEVVYGNSASNLSIGFVGEGISAQLAGNPYMVGLQFRCNHNNQNATNLMNRKAEGAPPLEQEQHTIRGFQGDNQDAAGNSFDQNTVWDFDKTTTQLANILYYYDPAFPGHEPVNVPADVVPIATTSGVVCGSGLVLGGHTIGSVKPQLQSSKQEYGSLRYAYDALIDGGSTNEVVNEIMHAWPQDAFELRDYLMARSPYLSTETLRELVDKAGIPVAIKLEVCLANPEATQLESFLKWAELDALYPLPAYALAAIEASWEERTFRHQLELQLAHAHTAMTQSTHHLLYLYRTDSAHAHPDSLRWVWQQLRTRSARYAEAGLLLQQARYAEALDLLEAMPTEKPLSDGELPEYGRMLQFAELLVAAKDNSRDAYTLNAQEQQDLEDLARDRYDRPAVWASNLLCAQYGQCRAPYTGGAPSAKSVRRPQRQAAAHATSTALGIHPNPANNWAAISYRVPGNRATLLLRIRDAQGRLAHTLQASGEEGQVLWDTRGTAPGVYTVELLRDGRVERTERLIIQP
ncbi:MAG: right-handed parallel beta-helix repeat-containing protein [Flavobacteriales bacterium]